eukprot:1548980-Rhodomonas_salina.1
MWDQGRAEGVLRLSALKHCAMSGTEMRGAGRRSCLQCCEGGSCTIEETRWRAHGAAHAEIDARC